MNTKKTGFGTRTGFALAAAGSAIGLGNLWGFPYKMSANGGSAYLFVYVACIILIGAVVMMAEFTIGRNAVANTVSAYKAVSPKMGWCGLLALVIPFLIICYYYVLGGFTVKFAFNSFAGNDGNFYAFAGNTGDVVLHSFLFALVAFVIVAAGVRGGIERASKILMPTIVFFLFVIIVVVLMLGEGVSDGLAYYLRPDFGALTPSTVLSAMGQAFFSLSLGCGVMIAYGSYSGKTFSLRKTTTAVCIIDIVISVLMGFAIFPAIYHYSAVTNVPVDALGLGDFSLMFTTMSMVFEDIPYIGRLISLLFFTTVAIAATTSVISLLEVVTQFMIQKYRVFRSKAVLLISAICFLISIPIAISLGGSLNGQETISLFGKNLLDFMDIATNTILMPICAIFSCIAARKILKKSSEKINGYYPLMVKFITPLLVTVVEILGIIDIIAPNGQFSRDGFGIVVTSYAVIVLCAVVYFGFMKNCNTGCNADERSVDMLEAEKRKLDLPRGWSRPESESAHDEN